MKIVNAAINEVTQKFRTDWQNLQDQAEAAKDLQSQCAENEVSIEALGRITIAGTRLALLVMSVAIATFSTALLIPTMIAGASMNPFAGLLLFATVLYVAHDILVEKDLYATTPANEVKNLGNQIRGLGSQFFNFSMLK